MHVCMYVCMHVYVCMHACMYVCMYACIQKSGGEKWSILQDDYMLGAKLTDWDKADRFEDDDSDV